MKDKICVITGATSGIGKETALALAGMGAHLILINRNSHKAEQLAAEIANKAGNSQVDLITADLSSMSQVKAAAAEINQKYDHIDVLVNNAGGMNEKYEETAEGFEKTFATNYFAMFLLTDLLLEKLKAAPSGRIVNVSSTAHRGGHIDLSNLMLKQGFAPFKAYSNTKLAVNLFTFELARRLQGTRVTANCLHPGVVATNFGAGTFVIGTAYRLGKMFMIDSKQGAQTQIYLASSPEVAGVSGKYFDESKIAQPSDASLDADLAAKLWMETERLLGVKFL